jgi:hypothetical protein
VVLEELKTETISALDGSFRFDALAPGRYHISVRTPGYTSRRTEVAVSTERALVDVRVDPDLHFQEVTSVSADTRSQFDTYQPTTVLSGQELTKQLESSLGATLENQSGIASRSFGPAPSRPVIRGLDGDRVLILQDGQRTGDLSSQSGDHGVSLNPAAAETIEVVRGPATLLYGANAIGGLVNVITNDIPIKPVLGTSGEVTLDAGTAAADRQWQVCHERRRRRTTIGRFRHAGGPDRQLAVAQRVCECRRQLDGGEGTCRCQLLLRRYEVRHSGRGGRHASAHAEAPCVDVPHGCRAPDRRV